MAPKIQAIVYMLVNFDTHYAELAFIRFLYEPVKI